jgi:phosphatidate phosphatase PAH1
MGLYDVINYFNYTPTNSCIDIVVIEQPDGTLKGSPFHVNFGFGSVLRSSEKNVYIAGKKKICSKSFKIIFSSLFVVLAFIIVNPEVVF